MGEVAGFDRRWVPLNGGGNFYSPRFQLGPSCLNSEENRGGVGSRFIRI